MSNSHSLADRLSRALTTPVRGVLGLVDDLLAASREQDVRLCWQSGFCQVTMPQAETPVRFEVPVQQSVFRAALARVAALCNESVPNSVSPYRGLGQVAVGSDSLEVIRVRFVNTPEEQSLELSLARRKSAQPPEEQSLAAIIEESGPVSPEEVI